MIVRLSRNSRRGTCDERLVRSAQNLGEAMKEVRKLASGQLIDGVRKQALKHGKSSDTVGHRANITLPGL